MRLHFGFDFFDGCIYLSNCMQGHGISLFLVGERKIGGVVLRAKLEGDVGVIE